MKRSTLTKCNFDQVTYTNIIQELNIAEKDLQNKYRILVQKSQELSIALINSRTIVKNTMITVPKWKENIQASLDIYNTRQKIVIHQLDSNLFLVSDNVQDIQRNITKIKEINHILENEIKILILRNKGAYTIIKNLMYAHFQIKMPKIPSNIPFPSS